MAVFEHPLLRTRIARNQKYEIDRVFRASPEDKVVSKQDLLRLGTYVDDSGTTQNVKNPLMQGQANELQLTSAGLLGFRNSTRTSRGSRSAITRTHLRFDYFKYQ